MPWVRTIVQNLVGNAKKHGPRGGTVVVRLSYLADTAEASIEVQDEGKGISPAEARSVFESSDGIGLKSVRTYVKGLGGSYGCCRNPSTFWVKFPAGNANGLAMNSSLTSFQSSRTERVFRIVSAKQGSPFLTVLTGLMVATVLQLYFATRPGTTAYDQPLLPVSVSFCINILIS